MLPPLLFAIVVDVITENRRRGMVNELLNADDLVLMKILEFFEKILELKGCNGKSLKVNTTKVISGSKGELFKSKIDPYGV